MSAPSESSAVLTPFDLALKARRLNRLVKQSAEVAGADFLHGMAEEILLDNVQDIRRQFQSILLLGCSEAMQRVLQQQFPLAEIVRIAERELVQEQIPLLPKPVQAIFTSRLLHRVNDVPGMLRQMADRLQPDGLLMACFPGGESLRELRQAFLQVEMQTGKVKPHIHPFMDVRDGGALLQRAGLALPIADKVTVTATYAHAFALMRELRAMGESNLLQQQHKGMGCPRQLVEVAEYYQQQFANTDGRIVATYELLTLIGWKPDASQPSPAKRGSGSLFLGDALNE